MLASMDANCVSFLLSVSSLYTAPASVATRSDPPTMVGDEAIGAGLLAKSASTLLRGSKFVGVSAGITKNEKE